MIYQSAHLIANSISIEGNLPADVGSGVTLRRPTEFELKEIRQLLPSMSGRFGNHHLYECDFIGESDTRTKFVPISDPSNWHYYVLSDMQGGTAVHNLEPTLVLLSPSLDLSVRVLSTKDTPDAQEKYSGMGPAPAHVAERYYYHTGNPSRDVVGIEDFRRADSLRLRIAELDQSFTFISKATSMMKDVRLVPQRSPLYVIGYFAVVESLIAHSPRLAESLDSISHQFQGKLSLLTNQLGMKNFVEEYFGEDKKIWKRLYSYRSALAHGNLINLKKTFRN
jgi:hypothetical protein